MSNDTKTAVEWFHQKTWALKIQLELGEISIGEYANTYATLYQQAKEMEKEQHSITWENTKSAMEVYKWESFQQYFNKTYGGDK